MVKRRAACPAVTITQGFAMKKLRLDIDALKVESFDPTADQDPLRGTVDGRQIEPPPISVRISECFRCLETQNSCFISCNGTCQSCFGTCFCPSADPTDCNCPVRTDFCPIQDTRLCPIEDTRIC